jgi:nucleotide-binding universal stress UspA family protein
LFHVLEPVPHHLYEHGGSESPTVQSRLGEELRRQREDWFEAEERREYPIVARAQQILAETGFPAERIALKLGRQHEVRNAILDEARAGGFDTVVVGTHGRTPGIKGLLGATGKEPLPSRLAGIALWIVG